MPTLLQDLCSTGKKAFSIHLKLKFIFSLTSLRKYQRINNIVIHHPTNKGAGQAAARKAAAAVKKTTAAKNKAQQQQVAIETNKNGLCSKGRGTIVSFLQNCPSTNYIDAKIIFIFML